MGITAFTGVQASQHYKSGAMGIGWSLGNLGAVSFDAIHARSQQKGRGRDSGDTWSIRYSKSFELTNTDLTAARYQYTSSGFHTLSDVLSTFRNDNFRAYSYSGDRSRRTTLRLNQSLGSLGYMSFTVAAMSSVITDRSRILSACHMERHGRIFRGTLIGHVTIVQMHIIREGI